MINLPMPNLFGAVTDEEAEAWYNDPARGSCDTNNSYEAIETIDQILQTHGLQIGLYDEGSSSFRFTVVPFERHDDGMVDPRDQLLAEAHRIIDEMKTKIAQQDTVIRGAEAYHRKRLDQIAPDELIERMLCHTKLDAIMDLRKALSAA